MNIVFVSNYFNHHQKPFSLAMDELTGHRYTFVATGEMSEERKALGYADMNKGYPWIVRTYESEAEWKRAEKIILDADVVIYGNAPQALLVKRLKSGKLTFKYSERLYKKLSPWHIMRLRYVKSFFKQKKEKRAYLLCTSAYTAADYAKTHNFINKAYKWGYFPEVKRYENVDELMESKGKNTLLWVGRLIDWKHAESAIEVAKALKDDGYDYTLDIIGTGEEEGRLREQIEREGLEKEVRMLGAMPPERVREYMERSEIYLFTSDRNEGWGAVLNESMNSGCAVVASHAIGAVPFLVKDQENGLIYKDGDTQDLCAKVKSLLNDRQKRKEMGKKAYATMVEEWNAENAAKRLLELSQRLLNGEKGPEPYTDGVCSRAEILRDDWY